MSPNQQPLDPSIVALAQSISKAETGGSSNPYSQKGASGEYGAYQYTPETWAGDSQKYLGQAISLTQATPAQQDEVAYNKIKTLGTQGYTPAQIASIWNSGKPDPTGNVGVNKYGVAYDTPEYVAKVEKNYEQFRGQGGSTANATGQTAEPITPGNPLGMPSGPGSFATAQKNIAALPGEVLSLGKELLPAIPDIYNDITGKNSKTALQQIGDVGSTALTLGTLIPGVDLADLGVKGALEAAPSLVAKLTRGGLLGGAFGASGALGAGQTDPTQIALSTGEGAAGGAAAEGLLSKIFPGSTLNKSIQDTMPLENKATRIDALRSSLPSDADGGVTRTGLLGTSAIQPSTEDVARGTAADAYVSKTNDPVKKIQNLNQGIIDESKNTDSFLDQNAASANFADMRDYVESNNIPDANLQKDPGAYANYQRATQNGLDTLAQVMSDASKETGDYGPQVSASIIRKARIDIDQQISRELGENTFGTPQYKGIKAAELGMRNTLNRMSEDMLRYPGQLENVNKMNSFISAAKGRGIEVDMTNPQVRAQLEAQFGLKATPEGEAMAQKLAAQHRKMSYLYDARDNMIDKYQRKIGKNKVQETIENAGPVTGGLINIAKKAIPFGIGDHVL